MEKIAAKLTDYILAKKMITEEYYDIYNYGFVCFLEIAASMVTCLIIALSLNMFVEFLFFSLIFIPIRSFGGGFHLSSFSKCYLLSCLVLTGTLVVVKMFSLAGIISYVGCIVFAILIFIIGPIDHPNRPVTEEENKLFKRRTALALLACVIVATVLYITKIERFLFLECVVLLVLTVSFLIPKIYRKIVKE